MRTLLRAVIALPLAACLAASLPACEEGRSQIVGGTKRARTRPAKPAATSGPVRAAGPVRADPSALSIIVSGELRGRLEPCGCSEHQRGGLTRRPVALPAGRMQVRVELGSLVEGLAPHTPLKFRMAMRALATMHYAAVVPGPYDLALIAEVGVEQLGQDPPLLCANLRREDGGPLLQAARRVRLRAEGTVTVDLVGVISDNDEASEAAAMIPEAELIDPAEAAREALKYLASSSRADVNVLLFAGPSEELPDEPAFRRLWDVIVCQGFADEPELEPPGGPDEPVIVAAGMKGHFLGQVVLPRKGSDRRKAFLRALPVEDAYKPDPILAGQFQQYLDELRAMDPMVSMPRLQIRSGPRYVGSNACAECHEDEYRFWKQTQHSRATGTLIKKHRQFDPDCIRCHAVAVEYESGFVSMDKTPELAGVGCEACHGPGSAHADNPTVPYPVPRKNCDTCHDEENDPTFELPKYLPKIKHW